MKGGRIMLEDIHSHKENTEAKRAWVYTAATILKLENTMLLITVDFLRSPPFPTVINGHLMRWVAWKFNKQINKI